MAVDAPLSVSERSRRSRGWGVVALLFVIAQMIVVAHGGARPDYLLDHSPSTCAVCLAGAAFDDPSLNAAAVAAPVAVAAAALTPRARRIVPEALLLSAEPRGPPAC